MAAAVARARTFGPTSWAAIVLYLAAWSASFLYMRSIGVDLDEPMMVFGIFGVGLSVIAWALTIGANAPPIEVKRPALESGVLLVYLLIYATAFLGFGLTYVREIAPPGQLREVLTIALKLTAHVALPALIILMLGEKLGPITQAGLKGRKFWRTLVVMGAIVLGLLCVVSPSLKHIQETGAAWSTLAWAAPASFVWITIEAGLCEEFFFRAVLQTRFTALFRSPWMGIAVTAILFGLAHAPGLYLRGGEVFQNPLHVIAYTITSLSPMGLLFGLLYARTKSLLLVVLLHGLVDVLPSMQEFIQIWT